jgi:hypothetical protein
LPWQVTSKCQAAIVGGEYVHRNCTMFLHWTPGGILCGLKIQSPSLSRSQLPPYARPMTAAPHPIRAGTVAVPVDRHPGHRCTSQRTTGAKQEAIRNAEEAVRDAMLNGTPGVRRHRSRSWSWRSGREPRQYHPAVPRSHDFGSRYGKPRELEWAGGSVTRTRVPLWSAAGSRCESSPKVEWRK